MSDNREPLIKETATSVNTDNKTNKINYKSMIDNSDDSDNRNDGSDDVSKPFLRNAKKYMRDTSVLRWPVLLFACLTLFANYYCNGIYDALSDELQSSDKTFGKPLTKFQFAYTQTFYSFPNMVLPLFGGFITDKIGTANSLVFMSVVLLIGQILCWVATDVHNYILLLVARFIFGIGGESVVVAQSALLTLWFEKERAFAMGMNLSIARLGGFLNQQLSPYVYNKNNNGGLEDASWVGIIIMIVGVGSAIIVYLIEKRAAKHIQRSREDGHIYPEDGKLDDVKISDVRYFSNALWIITISCVVVYGAIIPFFAVMKEQLKFEGFGKEATSLRSLPSLISAIASPFLGGLVDIVGRRVMLLLVCTSGIMGAHILFLTQVVLPIYGVVLLGFSYALYASALWPSISLVVKGQYVGTAYGVVTAIQNIGLTTIPLLVAAMGVTVKEGDPAHNIEPIIDYSNVFYFWISVSFLGFLSGIALYFTDYADKLKMTSTQLMELGKREEQEKADDEFVKEEINDNSKDFESSSEPDQDDPTA